MEARGKGRESKTTNVKMELDLAFEPQRPYCLKRHSRSFIKAIISALRYIVFATVAISALAGPPFRTDDPEPVPYQHGEVYMFSSGTQGSGGWSGVGPAGEANYGILPDTQFHLVMPIAYDVSSGAGNHFGYGDTEVGVKYRFVHQTDSLPDIGIFPMVEIPTGDQNKGLGNGAAQYYLPVWIQKDFDDGKWTSYGGGGYWINPGLGNKNWWFTGALLQRNFDAFFLGAEVFHATANTVGSGSSTGFNVGGGVNLEKGFQLLWSAGSGIQNHGANRFSYYLGLYRAF